MKINILDNKINDNFTAYLQDLGISPLSLKNYKSDISHFTGWLILKTRVLGVSAERLTECFPFLTKNIGHEYRTFLLENSTPRPTINRRLSTLRHLSRFLTESQIINFDFMDNLENINSPAKKVVLNPLLEDFEKHLKQNKASSNTIKNYLSDVRHFLTWLEINHYSPTTNH